jgi:Mn-dependent DtxR family transcriptional regulator
MHHNLSKPMHDIIALLKDCSGGLSSIAVADELGVELRHASERLKKLESMGIVDMEPVNWFNRRAFAPSKYYWTLKKK